MMDYLFQLSTTSVNYKKIAFFNKLSTKFTTTTPDYVRSEMKLLYCDIQLAAQYLKAYKNTTKTYFRVMENVQLYKPLLSSE